MRRGDSGGEREEYSRREEGKTEPPHREALSSESSASSWIWACVSQRLPPMVLWDINKETVMNECSLYEEKIEESVSW